MAISNMDNAAYIQESAVPVKQVRIPLQVRTPQEVRAVTTATTTTTTTTGNGNQSTAVCRPDVCRRARSSYTATQSDSPWHKTKTQFLIGTIVLLCIWIIVYSILSTMNVL